MKRKLLSIFYFLSLLLSPVINVSASSASSVDYESGEELYDLACSICHGKNMVNPGTSSFNLIEFPKNEKTRFVESLTNGKGFMPPFGEIFDAEEIEQLWIYISQTEK